MDLDNHTKKEVEALAGALQKVTVDGGEVEMSNVEESLSAAEREVIAHLRDLQEEHSALSALFEAAVLQLKLDYEEKYKPLYKKRSEILCEKSVTDGESDGKLSTGTPALPSFWVRALKSNRLLADMIEDHDEGPLSYLRNIQCEWIDDKNRKEGVSKPAAGEPVSHPESFRLLFTFVENPYFKPLTLKKEYHLSVAPGGRGAELTSTSSTQVEWLPDKNVTKKTVIRKQRNRKTKQTRTVAETVDANSFFNLFVDHDIPSDERLEEMDEKEVEELQMVVEADYDIGITIRDKIIPRAVEWFLGQVEDDSDFEDYDLNEDGFDSDDSAEDSSDEEPQSSNKGSRH